MAEERHLWSGVVRASRRDAPIPMREEPRKRRRGWIMRDTGSRKSRFLASLGMTQESGRTEESGKKKRE